MGKKIFHFLNESNYLNIPIIHKKLLWISKVVIHRITLLQSSLSLVMRRRSSNQRRNLKPLNKAVVAMEREAKTIMKITSISATRINLMEGIMMKTVIILEMMSKRVWISGCAIASAINMDGIIPTPLFFILSGRVIQLINYPPLIMTVKSCQSPCRTCQLGPSKILKWIWY